MSFWKMLGGVAAGVGAVAALPVAGPIGAVTAVGAVVGGAIGGTAGAITAFSDEDELKQRDNAVKEERTKRIEQNEKSRKSTQGFS